MPRKEKNKQVLISQWRYKRNINHVKQSIAIFQANFHDSFNVNFSSVFFSCWFYGPHLRSGCHLACVCLCVCMYVNLLFHRKSRFIFITVICRNCDSSTILWNFSQIKHFFIDVKLFFYTYRHTKIGSGSNVLLPPKQVHLINCNWNLDNIALAMVFLFFL